MLWSYENTAPLSISPILPIKLELFQTVYIEKIIMMSNIYFRQYYSCPGLYYL